MGISFNPNTGVRFIRPANINSDNQPLSAKQSTPDTFVKTDNSARYLERIDKLFPYGELNDIYAEMCKELELDYPPQLVFETGKPGEKGGGYTFHSNRINLNIQDILTSDYKLMGVKDGQKELLVDPKTMTPLFIDKVLAGLVVKNPKNAVLKGYDELVAEPVTDEEQRKLFLMKLRHELVHAKQHMIMRQTEGLGAKAIIKAWQHFPPNNGTPKYIIDQLINGYYQKSFWADKPDIIKYKKHSPEGEYAAKCLDAVQNYPPVTSPLYNTNFIELEAYKSSSDYIIEKYGNWE